MTNNKYKILVLSDLKDTTSNTIKSGISLAKIVDGDLHFFHVKKPTDVVDQESQLSAIRTINRSYLETSDEINKIIEPISKNHDISISTSHAFGNVKSEIRSFIKTCKPDVIILGKRKSKSFKFVGDNITDFVIKNHDGAVVIASAENALEPNKELSLGVLNSLKASSSTKFTNSILSHTRKPLKSFKTNAAINKTEETFQFEGKNTVEFVFDYGEKSMQSLSNFLTKSDVNLLCMDRQQNVKDSSNFSIANVIDKLNVSLLLSGEKHIAK